MAPRKTETTEIDGKSYTLASLTIGQLRRLRERTPAAEAAEKAGDPLSLLLLDAEAIYMAIQRGQGDIGMTLEQFLDVLDDQDFLGAREAAFRLSGMKAQPPGEQKSP